MSARRPDVVLAPQAERDFAYILVYTRRTWGERQKTVYRAAVIQALEMLAEYPDSGRRRDEIFEGCRSLRAQQHVIFYYQPEPDEIVVVRILHYRQDAGATVKPPET